MKVPRTHHHCLAIQTQTPYPGLPVPRFLEDRYQRGATTFSQVDDELEEDIDPSFSGDTPVGLGAGPRDEERPSDSDAQDDDAAAAAAADRRERSAGPEEDRAPMSTRNPTLPAPAPAKRSRPAFAHLFSQRPAAPVALTRAETALDLIQGTLPRSEGDDVAGPRSRQLAEAEAALGGGRRKGPDPGSSRSGVRNGAHGHERRKMPRPDLADPDGPRSLKMRELASNKQSIVYYFAQRQHGKTQAQERGSPRKRMRKFK